MGMFRTENGLSIHFVVLIIQTVNTIKAQPFYGSRTEIACAYNNHQVAAVHLGQVPVKEKQTIRPVKSSEKRNGKGLGRAVVR